MICSTPRTRLLTACIALLLTLGGCGSGTPQTDLSRKIVYGLTLSPSGFDPHRNESSEMGIVLRQVYDTLIYRHPDTGQFIPGLASEWAISDDMTAYTFTLKSDVRFHDGTPFNAAAVGATLDRIVNPDTRSQRALTLLGPYTGYTIVDEFTITLQLAEPYSPLLDSLSQFYLGIASPTALATYPNERYQFNQVGTGPYIFETYIPNERVTLRRNPEYRWGPEFYREPEAGEPLQEVEFRFFTEPSSRLTALEDNQAQIMGELLPLDARSLTGNTQIQLIPSTVAGQPLQFQINTSRFPTDNIAFRRALIQASNRQAIADAVFQGFSPAAWGPLSRNMQFYNPQVENAYPHNIQQAQALLSTLGYVDADRNGFLDVGATDLEVIVIVPPWGLIPQVAQLLQDQWRAVGVKAVLRTVPDFATLLNEVQSGDYHLVAFNAFGVDPAFIASYYTSAGLETRNWSRFSSPDIDNLLLEAQRALDPNLRGTLYGQVQAFIMDQAIILPIRDYVNLNAARATIRGLRFDIYGWYPILYNASYVGN
jgi:peptide/nickel transport system substrate-binding protein